MSVNTIDWTDFYAFAQEFEAESDRAAVILGVVKLDLQLRQLIDGALLPSPTSEDELLGGGGDAPLGAFSARINASYRLGLIDARFARALHIVRRIRNALAHELSGSNLDSGGHKDRVKELMMPFRGLSLVQEFEKNVFAERKRTGASADVRTILALMIGRLEYALAGVRRIACPTPITLTPDEWKTPTPTEPETSPP